MFSDDGTHIVVGGYDGYTIHVSQDSGETWTAKTGHARRLVPAPFGINEDGHYMSYGGANSGGDGLKSRDYGTTWTATGAPNGTTSGDVYYYYPATSADGQYTIVGRSWNSTTEAEKVWRSTDYINTFSGGGDSGMLNKYMIITMDSTGQYVMAGYSSATYNPGLWISDDYGATWSQITTNYCRFDISRDSDIFGYINIPTNTLYTSINQGSSWRSLSVDANSNIVISHSTNKVFQYPISGTTFYEINSNGISRTLINTFPSAIRAVSCGDNEIGVILTNKDLYIASYDDVTTWTKIYTFEGTSASTYLYMK